MEDNKEIKEEENVQPELSDLENALKIADDYKDKYVRLYAEFENYRKRVAKEKSELINTASENVIKTLLPTVDNLERSLKVNEDEGVRIIYNNLISTLDKQGLKEMSGIGTEFTADLHEAITQIPTDDLKGKIVDVLEKGYTLNGKVIRFAKIVVGI